MYPLTIPEAMLVSLVHTYQYVFIFSPHTSAPALGSASLATTTQRLPMLPQSESSATAPSVNGGMSACAMPSHNGAADPELACETHAEASASFSWTVVSGLTLKYRVTDCPASLFAVARIAALLYE